jgi:hypothetical protein
VAVLAVEIVLLVLVADLVEEDTMVQTVDLEQLIKVMLEQEAQTLEIRTVQVAAVARLKHLLNQPGLAVELAVTEFQVV